MGLISIVFLKKFNHNFNPSDFTGEPLKSLINYPFTSRWCLKKNKILSAKNAKDANKNKPLDLFPQGTSE